MQQRSSTTKAPAPQDLINRKYYNQKKSERAHSQNERVIIIIVDATIQLEQGIVVH